MKKLTYPLNSLESVEKEGERLVPLYKTAKGKYFIIRTSKKTGNKYHEYINFE